MSYGYTDSSEVGPGKQGGKFGLNSGLVSKFEFNANAGAGGAAGEAIDFTVQIGEKEFMQRFFPVSKVYADKGGAELTDPTTDEYKAAHKKAVALFSATLTDIAKVFVSEEDLKQALATPIATFRDYAMILERLVKSNPSWNKIPVDVFLEYQWKPSGENTRTFLTLPKNVKQGSYVVKSNPGVVYTEDRTSTHLRYATAEGVQHTFKRGEWYVGSAYAIPTVLDEAGAPTDMSGAAPGAGAQGDW